jgi:hypothetical protein|tara:strand:+ start:661 stop:843 length:183 start_codon:yes stop_codon:yes gene_type:complete
MNKDNITEVKKLTNSSSGSIDYRVVWSGGVSLVPEDVDNYHYQAIQEWVAAGNTIVEVNI